MQKYKVPKLDNFVGCTLPLEENDKKKSISLHTCSESLDIAHQLIGEGIFKRVAPDLHCGRVRVLCDTCREKVESTR